MNKSHLVIICLYLAGTCAAREYAGKASSDSAKLFLEQSSAVAISDSTLYFDGGSESFTFTSSEGKSFDFIISAEKQRKAVPEFLGVLESRSIHLLSATDSEADRRLLASKLILGMASGMQGKWPRFSDEAEAVLKLIKEGGYPHDMDLIYKLAAARTERDRGEKPRR